MYIQLYIVIFTGSNHTDIISRRIANLAASTDDQHGGINNQRPSPSAKVFPPAPVIKPSTTSPVLACTTRTRTARAASAARPWPIFFRSFYFHQFFLCLPLRHSVSIKSQRLLVHYILFPDCPLRNGFNN